MINRTNFILIITGLLCAVPGCQLPWRTAETKYVDPALPMTLNRHELVDYLNSQHQGLKAWRCTSTVMWVRLPNGLRQRLEGVIACQAPRYFRLTAENLIADADLGSNDTRCWMYVRPGDPAVLSWRHEDTALLQQMPTGMPYIDPNWLMYVLGVKPLNPDDYEVSRAPGGARELWLTAIEDSPAGRPLRRVIKVDTIRGVVREHAVYDSEAHPLVRAQLKNHRPCNGHMIPTGVTLEFPQMDSEIALTFKNIETNPHLPSELWALPDRNMQVVDLGNVIRSRMQSGAGSDRDYGDRSFQAPRARLTPPDFGRPVRSASGPPPGVFDGSPAAPSTPEEPDWDHPVSYTTDADAEADVFDEPAVPRQQKRERGGFFSLFRR
ncbi:MAG: hypothetical protein RIK87_03330 [Fuerstiella sp.]